MTPARKWWQPRPFEWGSMELLVMRAAFAALIFLNARWDVSALRTQEHPNGLAHLFDLTWLAHHSPGVVAKSVIGGLLALYVAGFLPALGLLPITVFAVLSGTLVNSQGAINHSWQLVTLMALAQLAVFLCPRRNAGSLEWHPLLRPDLERHRVAAWAALNVIAASYVVSAVVKLLRTDGRWIADAPNLAVQLVKTHQSEYYDSLQMPAEWLQRVTQFFLEHPYAAMIVFGSGLLIELGGFVLLISRRWSFLGGVAIVAMHLSISKLMKLNFEAHIAAVTIFAVNLPGIAKAWRRQP